MNLSNSEWGAVHKNHPCRCSVVLECSSILASGFILLGRNLEFCFDNGYVNEEEHVEAQYDQSEI